MDSFLDVADKTRIELAELSQTAEQYSHPYKTGELTAPGSLSCEKCAKVIAFKSTSIIPECPECGANTFYPYIILHIMATSLIGNIGE